MHYALMLTICGFLGLAIAGRPGHLLIAGGTTVLAIIVAITGNILGAVGLLMLAGVSVFGWMIWDQVRFDSSPLISTERLAAYSALGSVIAIAAYFAGVYGMGMSEFVLFYGYLLGLMLLTIKMSAGWWVIAIGCIVSAIIGLRETGALAMTHLVFLMVCIFGEATWGFNKNSQQALQV